MAPFSQVTRNQQWFLITGTKQANKHRAPYEITNDGSPFFSSHNWDHQCYENYFHLFLLTKYAHQSQPSNLDFLCSFVYGEKKSLILKYYSSRIRNTQIKTIMIYHLKKKNKNEKLFVIYKISITEKVFHHTPHSVCESVENRTNLLLKGIQTGRTLTEKNFVVS